jgi:hypothetical protein
MLRAAVAASLLLGATSAAFGQDDSLAARIREANARATKAIAHRWRLVRNSDSPTEPQAQTLVALTLLRAGGPDERAEARKILDAWWLDAVAGNFGQYSNYSVALGISSLEGLSLERRLDHDDETSTLTRYDQVPLAPELRKRLEIASKSLMRSASRAGGTVSWGYRTLPFETGETKERLQPDPLTDSSNTQFAALALHDAARGGIAVPAELTEGLAASYVKAPDEKGEVRWGYAQEPTPSMTFAALSTLAICRALGARNDGLDASIQGGLKAAAKLVTTAGPSAVGQAGRGNAYTLYSLEKALDLLEAEALDGKEWFPQVAERVLKAQGPAGLWGESDLIDSCFYVLFLVRASFGASRLGPPRTVVRVSPEADALAAVKALGDAPLPGARAKLEEAVKKLAAKDDGAGAVLLGTLAELAKKAATREVAARCLVELCGKTPSSEEVALSIERLSRLRGACEPGDLLAALDRTCVLPVRAFAATKGASASSVLDAADVLDGESILETAAGSRCAHAFERAARRAIKGALPDLPARVAPSDLRWFVKVARERLEAEKDDAASAHKADGAARK